MRAHVEWIVGVMRVGPYYKEHGDPFDFSCTIIRRGDECEIIGASGKMTIATYRAIRNELESHGIKVATWDRSSGKHVAAKGRS